FREVIVMYEAMRSKTGQLTKNCTLGGLCSSKRNFLWVDLFCLSSINHGGIYPSEKLIKSTTNKKKSVIINYTGILFNSLHNILIEFHNLLKQGLLQNCLKLLDFDHNFA